MRYLNTITFLLSLLFSTILAQDRMATVDGFCYLEGETDHTGTKVLFEATSPSAVTDSAFTSETGSYSIGLADGIYAVHFFHDGYQPYTLPQNYTFENNSYTLSDVTLVSGAVQEVSGNVSGEWFSSTTYHVMGDITVDAGDTLIIYPGTIVKFMDVYSLSVYGSLFAQGAEGDSITFTSGQASPAAGDWAGIRFYSESDSSASVLQYCDMGYGSTGTGGSDGLLYFYYTYDAPIEVANSNIHHSTSNGISCNSYSSPMIMGNTVHNNNSYGIYCIWYSSPMITGNTVHNNNSYGIYCRNYSSPTITGNTVHNNNYYGIRIRNYSSPFIENNIITENSYGISAESQPEMIAYNDVWNNDNGDYYDGENETLPVDIGDLITINANGDSCDTYFNVSMDPTFVDSVDFHLLEGSPCIDTGDPDPAYYDADGTVADMGAFPYYQGELIAPDVDFTVSGTSGQSPFAAQFTHSNSGGPITSYLWHFGDGTSGTAADPVHTYVTAETATYSVNLSVSGPGGDDTVTYTDLITVTPANFPPVADFTADPLVGFGTVQFSDQSAGSITGHSWDFGDGGTSAEENPEHTYGSPGFYTVSLTVTGPNGADTETKEDYIQILEPEAVVAGFTTTATSGVAPVTVGFTNTSMGTITSYEWDFGDGDMSQEESPTHTYPDAGTFEVTLTVTGMVNNDTAGVTMVILSPEPAIISIEDVPDDQGGWVYLTFSSSGYDTETPNRIEMYTIERLDDDWVNVGSGSAYGADHYVFELHTAADSSGSTNGMTNFRVIASMDEGLWVSEPDSGYSIDNIAPSVPTGFMIVMGDNGLNLSWNSVPDEDFQYYVIDKSADSLFMTDQFGSFSTIDTFFNDANYEYGTVFYRVSALDYAGNRGDYSDTVSISILSLDSDVIPQVFALHQNYPNPFNPTTQIKYDLPEDAMINITIYDIMGRSIRSLVKGRQTAGYRSVQWNATNNLGEPVSAGMYIYMIQAGKFRQTKKMVLLK